MSMEGYEADDIIATCVEAARTERPVVIVGSDKDLMQLVDSRTVMVDPVKKILVTPDTVREKFGVGPELMIDLQAMAGDSSDNIPGIKGVGPKIAAELLGTWGSLDEVCSL